MEKKNFISDIFIRYFRYFLKLAKKFDPSCLGCTKDKKKTLQTLPSMKVMPAHLSKARSGKS